MSWLSAAGGLLGTAIGGPWGAAIGAGVGTFVENAAESGGPDDAAHDAALARLQADKLAALPEERRLEGQEFLEGGRFEFGQGITKDNPW